MNKDDRTTNNTPIIPVNNYYWHYKRTCLYCGNIWGGLHCIHDGYQNPCPKCGKIPLIISSEDGCECLFDS